MDNDSVYNIIEIKSMNLFKRRFIFADMLPIYADNVFEKYNIKVSGVAYYTYVHDTGKKFAVTECKVYKKDVAVFEKCMKELDTKLLLLGGISYREFIKFMHGRAGTDTADELQITEQVMAQFVPCNI